MNGNTPHESERYHYTRYDNGKNFDELTKLLYRIQYTLEEKFNELKYNNQQVEQIKNLIEETRGEIKALTAKITEMEIKINTLHSMYEKFDNEYKKLAHIVDTTKYELAQIKKDIEKMSDLDDSYTRNINSILERINELEKKVLHIETKYTEIMRDFKSEIERIHKKMEKKEDKSFQWIIAIGTILLSAAITYILNKI
jgi:chromosome segregation ATPase